MTTDSEEKKVATISDYTKLTNWKGTHEEIGVVKKTICKDLNDAEFIYFLNVCAATGLNPLLHQIWVYREPDWWKEVTQGEPKQLQRGKLVCFTGRDGHYVNAERHPQFKGMTSAEVRANDEFSADITKGTVEHKIKQFDDRGPILGAYAICYRDGMIPRVSVVKLSEYKKEVPVGKKKGAWDNNTADMIITRAEDKALAKQFPISGVQSEYNWKFDKDGHVEPINKNDEPESQENLQFEAEENLMRLWEDCKDKDRGFYKKEILRERAEGKLTMERIAEWTETLTTPKERFVPEEAAE